MDYKVTIITCANCDKKIDTLHPCLEVCETKWVNGYYSTESESIYFCQDCCADGIDIRSKKDLR